MAKKSEKHFNVRIIESKGQLELDFVMGFYKRKGYIQLTNVPEGLRQRLAKKLNIYAPPAKL